ncbi:hypothetical protein RND81_10G074500 [Saponaria officinalis]|uniref:Uncharacterized protein n=1 Tax=Saponaria officinalis TaxID=3572 RepID=A0AAW1I1G1_SAPOF
MTKYQQKTKRKRTIHLPNLPNKTRSTKQQNEIKVSRKPRATLAAILPSSESGHNIVSLLFSLLLLIIGLQGVERSNHASSQSSAVFRERPISLNLRSSIISDSVASICGTPYMQAFKFEIIIPFFNPLSRLLSLHCI